MAEDKSKDEKKEETAAPAELSGTKKLMVMGGIIVAILVILSVISVVFINRLKPEDPELIAEKVKAAKEEEEKKKATEFGETLEKPMQVLVNLAGADSVERFLKADLRIEYETPVGWKAPPGGKKEEKGPVGFAGEIEKRMPKFKEIAIDILSSKSYEEVKDAETRKKIAVMIKNEYNKNFQEPDIIKNIYFESFVIQ